MNWKEWRQTTLYIAIAVALIIIPIVIKNLYYLGTITFILINWLLAVSLWFILITGQLSLGHAGSAAIGGYLSAVLIKSFGLSSWLSLFISVATAGAIAVIIGYITLRIKGVYFMIVTLALCEVIRIVFGMWDHPFGGLNGILDLPAPDPIAIPGLPVIKFISKPPLYYLTLVFVLLGIVIMQRLHRSHIGRVFHGIRQADSLAEHLGINIMGYKVLAFVIGSCFAGLAGILYTYSTNSIMPTSFTVIQSTYYLVYVAVGGEANIIGPILGVTFLNILSEILRPIKEFEPIVYGLLLIGAILLFRGGLLGIVNTLWRTFSRKMNSRFAKASS
jgi:branched-chain amino acid transport system permease protein